MLKVRPELPCIWRWMGCFCPARTLVCGSCDHFSFRARGRALTRNLALLVLSLNACMCLLPPIALRVNLRRERFPFRIVAPLTCPRVCALRTRRPTRAGSLGVFVRGLQVLSVPLLSDKPTTQFPGAAIISCPHAWRRVHP